MEASPVLDELDGTFAQANTPDHPPCCHQEHRFLHATGVILAVQRFMSAYILPMQRI
jgi:hypothetical protein